VCGGGFTDTDVVKPNDLRVWQRVIICYIDNVSTHTHIHTHTHTHTLNRMACLLKSKSSL